MTTATLMALLSTGATAQRYGHPAPRPPTYNDDYQFDRHLDWRDRELNLSRRQERGIYRIRTRFEQQTGAINHPYPLI